MPDGSECFRSVINRTIDPPARGEDCSLIRCLALLQRTQHPCCCLCRLEGGHSVRARVCFLCYDRQIIDNVVAHHRRAFLHPIALQQLFGKLLTLFSSVRKYNEASIRNDAKGLWEFPISSQSLRRLLHISAVDSFFFLINLPFTVA